MLTGKQKSYLKGLSHNMQPIIQIGKNGVNEMLVKTIEDALEARELIKISVLIKNLIKLRLINTWYAEKLILHTTKI